MLPPDLGFDPLLPPDPPLPGDDVPPLGRTGVEETGGFTGVEAFFGAEVFVLADGLDGAVGVVLTVGTTDFGAAAARFEALRVLPVLTGAGAGASACVSSAIGSALLRWVGIAAPALASGKPGTCSAGVPAGRSWRPIA